MKNKKSKEKVTNVYDYVNWLEKSGRITLEENIELIRLINKLEEDILDYASKNI
jgi:hypothetical protein